MEFINKCSLGKRVTGNESLKEINFKKYLVEVQNSLFGFAFRLTRNRDDAKDLYQDAIYLAYKNFSKFDGSNFKGWSHTILHNTHLSKYRKTKKKNSIINNTGSTVDDFVISSSAHVMNTAESAMRVEKILDAIESLETRYKDPFRYHLEGYHYDEISEKLDIPMGTVKSRIFYARRELKKALTKFEIFE